MINNLLGGILGYMYHWTGNLWVPIFAHLVNNAVQIIGQYFFQKGMIETNIDRAILDVNWVMTLVAFAVVGVLSFAMKKLNDRNQEELTI